MPEFDPATPYNALPLLPPATESLETPAILKKCIAARVALAELKQAAERLKTFKVNSPEYAAQEEQVASMESKLRLDMARKRKELADAEASIYYENYKLIANGVSTPLVFGTNAWTAGTRGPRRGPALLEPRSADELAALKDRLRGAWVVSRARPARRRGRRGRRGAPGARLREAVWKAGIAGWVTPVRGELIRTSGRPLRSRTCTGWSATGLPTDWVARSRRSGIRPPAARWSACSRCSRPAPLCSTR